MGVKFNQTHAFDAISKSWVVPIRWSSWLSAWATKSTASTGLHRSTSFSRKTTEPWKLREWLPAFASQVALDRIDTPQAAPASSAKVGGVSCGFFPTAARSSITAEKMQILKYNLRQSK